LQQIPKVIHYCWFGNNPLPKLAKKCIKSWKKTNPDYEIKRWDQTNFDLDAFPYAREAYDVGKMAFVSDVARLWAIYTYGGIYMDTDVQVYKSFDPFLHEEAFSGYEDAAYQFVATAVMGGQKQQKLIGKMLDYYSKVRHFVQEDGSFDITPNPQTITHELVNAGFVRGRGDKQTVAGFTIYPKTYFCPLNWNNDETDFSEHTVAAHLFNGSWLPKAERRVQHLSRTKRGQLVLKLEEKIKRIKKKVRLRTRIKAFLRG
jgi:hypothetical protein